MYPVLTPLAVDHARPFPLHLQPQFELWHSSAPRRQEERRAEFVRLCCRTAIPPDQRQRDHAHLWRGASGGQTLV
ncbi:MAG: hypothetical protein IPK19_39880 [Chloroflexi bacterium]|nr:hypothetical protein [Chloroflexota bacterium]